MNSGTGYCPAQDERSMKADLFRDDRHRPDCRLVSPKVPHCPGISDRVDQGLSFTLNKKRKPPCLLEGRCLHFVGRRAGGGGGNAGRLTSVRTQVVLANRPF
jgi:hypothetical protein